MTYPFKNTVFIIDTHDKQLVEELTKFLSEKGLATPNLISYNITEVQLQKKVDICLALANLFSLMLQNKVAVVDLETSLTFGSKEQKESIN